MKQPDEEPDDPREPFGAQTIEHSFINGIDYSLERDGFAVTVRTPTAEPVEIDSYELELGERDIGQQSVAGVTYPAVEMTYILSVPVIFDVQVGDDVIVSGYESDWTFTDIHNVVQNDSSTIVVTNSIDRSYGSEVDPYDS